MTKPTMGEIQKIGCSLSVRYSLFFSGGRLCAGTAWRGCEWCGSQSIKIRDGCLGYEGILCQSCGFEEDAHGDANRAEYGALYLLPIRYMRASDARKEAGE
jgi:hypothetical protein